MAGNGARPVVFGSLIQAEPGLLLSSDTAAGDTGLKGLHRNRHPGQQGKASAQARDLFFQESPINFGSSGQGEWPIR
jgi:hypothetical protein